jgi:hypothetical protein
MKKILCTIVFVVLNFTLKVNAQPSWFWQPSASGPYVENSNPLYSNWEKQTLQRDDFTATTLDITKWDTWNDPSCTNVACPTVPPGFYHTPPVWSQCQNISIYQNNSLNITLDQCTTTGICGQTVACPYQYQGWSYPYTSGGIQSHNQAAYKVGYGYLEAEIKLPGWPDVNHQNNSPTGVIGDGFHPSFWLSICAPCNRNEIDIMEPGGDQYTFANYNEGGVHDFTHYCQDQIANLNCPTSQCNGCAGRGSHKLISAPMYSATPLNEWHNYALEYLQDRIIFYFDYKPYAWIVNDASYDTPGDIFHSLTLPNSNETMYAIFGNGVDYPPGTGNSPLTGHQLLNATPPSYGAPNYYTSMFVDYFYYWKLKKDCSTPAVIHDDAELSNFQFAVKQSITFLPTTTVTIPATGQMNNLTFRATDEIDVKPGFTAPSGCTLDLNITPCN